MRIVFLPGRRVIELEGHRRVSALLKELNLIPGTVMVIRGDELVTDQETIEADESVEIRSVISGG